MGVFVPEETGSCRRLPNMLDLVEGHKIAQAFQGSSRNRRPGLESRSDGTPLAYHGETPRQILTPSIDIHRVDAL